MRRVLSALFILATSALYTASAGAAPTPVDQIAIIVNDGVILNSDVTQRVADLKFQAAQRKQTEPAPQVLQQQAREQLILEALQMQLAERNGLRPDDVAVNKALTRLASDNNMTLDAFRARLDATPGTNFASLREAVSREQVIERLRQRRMAERIHISDNDVAQFLATPAGVELNRQLDEQLRTKKTEVSEAVKSSQKQYLVTQIVVPLEDGMSAKQQAKATELAQRLLAEQRKGLSPEEVIDSQHGAASEAAIEPLGWRDIDSLPTLLVDPVKKLVASGTPDMLRSPRGWHLVWVLDRREVSAGDSSLPPPPPVPTTVIIQREVRHILIRPNELQSSEDVHQAMDEIYKQLKNGADFGELARLKSQDPGSAIKGGSLGWVSPGDMVPEFDKKIGETAVGQISEPFQSSYGWHILRIDGERKQDMRDSILKDRARQILYARAYDEELGAWLRELRAEAYIDYRGNPQ